MDVMVEGVSSPSFTVWMRLGMMPASVSTVASPACIDWPAMDLGKK